MTEYLDRYGNHHKENGAAVENDHFIRWLLHGIPHRIGGPAVICKDTGEQKWYRHGRLHRLMGPAIEWSDDPKHNLWAFNGTMYKSWIDLVNGNENIASICWVEFNE